MTAIATFHFAAQASGLKYLIAPSASVTATGDSLTGIGSSAWEIVGTAGSVPADWVLSAAGLHSVVVTAPAGTNKAAILQRTVTSGRDTLVTTAKLYSGTELVCTNETYESSASNGWRDIVNTAVSTLNGGGGSVITPIVTTNQTTLLCQPADRATAGAGYGASYLGGQANGANVGGDVRVGGGEGGTPGTHLPGNVLLDAGRTVGGAAGVIRIVTNTGGADVVRRHIDCLSGGVNDWTENETLDLYALALQLRSSNGVSITSCSLQGYVKQTGVISPAAIGANQTDYAPTGLLSNSRLRQDVSAACQINSMAAGTDGQRITIHNISGTAVNTLTLRHDDGTGTAAQRFLCPNNTSVVIRGNGSVDVVYDGTSSRWRVLAI